MSERPRVLVIEDGEEYVTGLRRFLGERFEFLRAGDGPEALDLLARIRDGGGPPVEVIFLDMRFDRAERLLGDADALAARFGGDGERARRFLENNQGAYVLAALRDAGWPQPVVFSYDFDSEPRRFRNLADRYGPLSYLHDTAAPAEIRAALDAARAGGR